MTRTMTPSAAAPEVSLLPASVLVADDEHLVAAGLMAMLRELDIEVVGPVADGEAAIERCASARPDLALLDIRMPRRDGLDAAREIHERLGIPTVIVSAFGDDRNAAAAGDAGVFGFLVKPVSLDQLRAGLAVAWRRALAAAEQSTRIDDLGRRIEDRKIVERAKWKLVAEQGLTEPEAHAQLQRAARSRRLALRDIAAETLDGAAD